MSFWLRVSLILAAPFAAGFASAQPVQPNLMILAQAQDRCMTTFAVRLTKTPATDEQIYAEATRSCFGLNEKVNAAINAQFPPAEAQELIKQLETNAKPNFMSLLAKIRSDRATANPPG